MAAAFCRFSHSQKSLILDYWLQFPCLLCQDTLILLKQLTGEQHVTGNIFYEWINLSSQFKLTMVPLQAKYDQLWGKKGTNCHCWYSELLGRQDSLVVRVLDLRSKGWKSESRQEWWENFLLQSQICVQTLIRCPFHPHVTAVARKIPWSFCQKCRRQVTPKHAYIFDLMKLEWTDYAAVQA